MPREDIVKARLERNEALIDAMMLAASADGELKAIELQTLLARVIERPEFEGTSPDELNAMVEGSAARLARAKDLSAILGTLRERLTDHRSRQLAFGLAASVALADRKATREELGLLKSLQAALGVTEAEVSQLFEAAESNRPLADVLGEPLERLYAETMVLMSAADGVLHPDELMAMLENMAGDAVFHEVSMEAAERCLRDAVTTLSVEGLPARLAVLARGLTTLQQRRKAYQLAVRVAQAGGAPTEKEEHTLDLLQATFGFSDDEAARLTKTS